MRTGSFLNALFQGDQQGEFTWFSVADNLPGLSMDADRAATEIVNATKRRQSELILSLPANLGARLYGLFPGTVVNLIALVNALILPPSDDTNRSRAKGAWVKLQIGSPLLDALVGWGEKAAQRLNQFSAPGMPAPRTDETIREL
jgi:hypothetical protein